MGKAGILHAPFQPGTGNWITTPYGSFDANINGWGGNGATPLVTMAHSTYNNQWNQLPFSNAGMLRFSATASYPDVWGSWVRSSTNVQMIDGEEYVISMFINMNGKESLNPALEWWGASVTAGISQPSWGTPQPELGIDTWQFVWTQFTYEGSNYPGLELYIATTFYGISVIDAVDFDEVALTPAAQFVPPNQIASPTTLIRGKVTFEDWVGGSRNYTVEVRSSQTGSILDSRAFASNGATGSYSFTTNATAPNGAYLTMKPIGTLRDSSPVTLQYGVQNVDFTLIPGDVDGSGEIDAADIDEAIANFGSAAATSDVDGSGEVDAADIDLIIQNFGGMDD